MSKRLAESLQKFHLRAQHGSFDSFAQKFDRVEVDSGRIGFIERGVTRNSNTQALVGKAQAIIDGTTPIRRIPHSGPSVDDRGLRMQVWF